MTSKVVKYFINSFPQTASVRLHMIHQGEQSNPNCEAVSSSTTMMRFFMVRIPHVGDTSERRRRRRRVCCCRFEKLNRTQAGGAGGGMLNPKPNTVGNGLGLG